MREGWPMQEELKTFLRQALAGRSHVLLCGGEATPLLAQVRALLDPSERALEVASQQGLLAALRQDPDAVVIELFRPEMADIVAQTALTGHRVIMACPGPPPVEFYQFGLEMAVVWLDERGGVLRLEQITPAPPACEPYVQPPAAVPEGWHRTEPLRASLERKLTRRICRVPRFAQAPEEISGDKFGGAPAMLAGESWPTCKCGSAMQFILQIEEEGHYLQLFYCDAPDCGVPNGWEPWAGNSLARTIPTHPVVALGPSGVPGARIAGWETCPDYPHSEERPELPEDEREAGYLASSWEAILNGDEAERTRLAAILDYYAMNDPEDLAAVSQMLTTRAGDKLGGWPYWTQAAAYPACPTCSEPMEMVLQLDAEEGFFRQLFAADGTGHVFRCRAHRDRLGFAWACT